MATEPTRRRTRRRDEPARSVALPELPTCPVCELAVMPHHERASEEGEAKAVIGPDGEVIFEFHGVIGHKACLEPGTQ